MAKVTKAGLIDGIITCHQIPNSEQPSMRAASSNSLGTARKACLNKNIPKAEAIPGKITPK